MDERRVRECRKQKEQLVSMPDKKRQLGTPGRKALLPDMEEKLAEWTEDQESAPTCHTNSHPDEGKRVGYSREQLHTSGKHASSR